MLTTTVTLPTLHHDQARLLMRTRDPRADHDSRWAANSGGRLKAVRWGRRGGKTIFLQAWQADGAMKGWPCGYFAPTYKYVSEVYEQMHEMLEPALRRKGGHNKTDMILRLRTGGSIEFWTLEDHRAGRSRKYRRAAVDEAAFTKNATNDFPNGQAIETWRRSIKPTLGDLRGTAIIASNTNGVDPTNLLWAACNDPALGFIEHHAPSWVNPHVPERLPGQSLEAWRADWRAYYRDLRAREHPLVFSQEYAADFVDWSGVAFLTPDKWLVDGEPVELPTHCDGVFAVVDSAVKTGSANDGTAVIYFARNMYVGHPLVILDWDVAQIEGALLDTWLPNVFSNLEHYAKLCKARGGSRGAWIEDKSTGMVLLQQGARRGWPVTAVPSELTALGKDERAISISSYHYQGLCKMSRPAWDKVVSYKGTSANHLRNQVVNYRIGDPKAATRADDLFDDYCYGLALALGDSEGW